MANSWLRRALSHNLHALAVLAKRLFATKDAAARRLVRTDLEPRPKEEYGQVPELEIRIWSDSGVEG